MKNLLKFIPAAFFLLAACKNTPEAKEDEHANHQVAETTTTPDGAAVESHEGQNVAVVLDNGKKWKANPETIESIKNMQTIIGNAKTTNASAVSLDAPLTKEFQTIFEKCTMTGEAHNQLHNYLVPLKDNLQKLGNEADATQALANIESHLGTFQNYFE